MLDSLPGRAALETRFSALMRTGSVSAPIMRRNRYFFTTRTVVQTQPVVVWREGYLGANHLLVDPSTLDPSGELRVSWISPAEDGRVLAFGASRAGQSGSTLHLVDVDTATAIALEIPNVIDAVQWLPDGSGFFYRTVDANGLQGLFHRMGAPVAADQQLFRQTLPADVRDVTSEWGPFATLSRDGHWIVLGYWRAPGSNDLWVANFDEFRKTGRLSAKVASVGVTGEALGTVVDGTLVLQTTKGAPNGRIVSVSANEPAQSHWREIVPERTDAVVESVSFGRDRIAVTYRTNAIDVIEVFSRTGQARRQPEAAGPRCREPRRRGRSDGSVPDLHELQLPADGVPHRPLQPARGADSVARTGGRRRSVVRRSRAGLVPVEGRDPDQHVSRAQGRTGAHGSARRRC